MSLLGLPWRVALALQADGWTLRSDIIRVVPAALAAEGPPRAHSYLFLLTKAKRYYYDASAIAQPLKVRPHAPGNKPRSTIYGQDFKDGSATRIWGSQRKGRNRRTVWHEDYERTVDLCILAGSAAGDAVLDPFSDGSVPRAAQQLGRKSLCIHNGSSMRPRLSQGDAPDPLYIGDVREGLLYFAKHGVRARTCVTSPPYWGLRDYGTAEWKGGDPKCKHEGKDLRRAAGNFSNAGQEARSGDCRKCGAMRADRQIGLEPTPEGYVATMVDVFRHVRDVLTDDGSVWLNLGDTYSGQGGFSPDAPSNVAGSLQAKSGGHALHGIRGESGLRSKNLIGIPWRVAFALQADGWYLRSDIIWYKPQTMPESITDRPTKAHEYLFLLTKSPRYYYDADALKEPAKSLPTTGQRDRASEAALQTMVAARSAKHPKHRKPNKGVLTGDRHFATRGGLHKHEGGFYRNKRTVWEVNPEIEHGLNHFAIMPQALVEPCILAGSALGDIVLDPFMGSGTVARVANRLGRKWIGCELNPDYATIIRAREQPKDFREVQLWRHAAEGYEIAQRK